MRRYEFDRFRSVKYYTNPVKNYIIHLLVIPKQKFIFQDTGNVLCKKNRRAQFIIQINHNLKKDFPLALHD